MEIQRADPAARRIALLIIGAGAIVGAVFIVVAAAFRPEIERWIRKDVRGRFRLVIAGTIAATAGPAFAAGTYCWRLGGRVVRAERFPPPEFRVIRDTPIVTGSDAVRRGRLARTCGAALAAAALLLAFFLWRLVGLMAVTR